MKTEDFDYNLPPELIAQEPLPDRDAARMMVIDRGDMSIRHASVKDLPEFLAPGDMMVFNNTRVFPARTRGVRIDTGGKVELVFVRELQGDTPFAQGFRSKWLCIFGSGSKTRRGQRLSLCGGAITAELTRVMDQGHVEAAIETSRPVMQVLDEEGQVPLPPYIEREAGDSDRASYQTVYASKMGAVAAPTAGLHFTPGLLKALEERGIGRCEVTLHVGPGTFLPVKADDLEQHEMHSEFYSIEESAADAINEAHARGNRVAAIGTTTVRTLEGSYAKLGESKHDSGFTDIFIYPPFDFKVTDVLLTNFHLPRSTLLMMVSAFADRELVLRAYEEAVAQKYRFYSYGDCMLIL